MNNCVLVKITGKHVSNYLKWLIKNKINIINLRSISYNQLYIVIDYKDYSKLTKYSKTYNVEIIEKYGRLRMLDIIKDNFVIISCLILSIFFVYFLSNYIFSVDIVYNNKEIVNLLNKELAKYDIKKYSRKKKYNYLTKVKDNILKNNKDVLEWLEIEESGTKYIVRLVERKKENISKSYLYQSIVAKKDATIVSIKAYSGEKNASINQYVKKGDTIINGVLTKPDGTNIYSKANGIVYGEVWYKVDIEYPLYYQEEKLTGRNKKVLSLYFLNKEIPLFPYKKYKQFNLKSKIVMENIFLPIKITKDKLYEVIVKESIYTNEEAANKAKVEATNKLINNNSDIIKIKDVQVLSKENLNSKIKLSLFISTIEDITEIREEKIDIEKQ